LKQHGLIICAGLYGSGSTWVFNVVAEIERLKAPATKIATVYGDELNDKLEGEAGGANVIVLKTHIPDAAMRLVASQTGTPVILSIRDPRDGIASLMQRFSFGFDDAADMVGKSSAAILRLVAKCRPLILRYEDRFTAGHEGIEQIAAHLGRTLSDDELLPLVQKLSSETVATFVEGLMSSGYFDDRPFGSQCHPETQWHPNHVGDGLIGKYASVLTEEQIALVGSRTVEFRIRFGYAGNCGIGI
jgi:hypothetical protein